MFIILLNYKVSVEEVDQFRPGHFKYLDRNYENGSFICSGPRIPRTGGVILCRAKSQEEVLAIIQDDPYLINDVVDYEIINFRAAHLAEGFEKFADKV